MAEQTLKRIEKAEQEGEKLLTITKKKCQEIRKRAHQEGENIISRAKAEVREKGARIRGKVLEEIKQETGKIKTQFNEKEAELKNPNKKYVREKAIRFILEKARETWEKPQSLNSR